MAREIPRWPPDLAWMIDALDSIPSDATSTTLKGRLEADRSSWLRLQALARLETSFTYGNVVVTFASPPVAVERSAQHSDMMPPRYRVSLELTVRKD